MTASEVFPSQILTKQARLRRPVRHWWGIRGGSTRKQCVCYICDATIATYAASYPMTKRAQDLIKAHGHQHIRETAIEFATGYITKMEDELALLD